MKKLSFLILLCLIVFSCNKNNEADIDHDVWSTYVEILVMDKDGNNLLDPSFDGNILKDNITLRYEDKTYKRLEYNPEKYNKFFCDDFQGLMTNTVDEIPNHPPVLSIGYFHPHNSFDNKKFLIDWGDGSEDEITFSQACKNQYPHLEYKFRLWLNGTELTEINKRQITIIR